MIDRRKDPISCGMQVERNLFRKKTYGEVLNLKVKAIIARERLQFIKTSETYCVQKKILKEGYVLEDIQ